MPTWADWLELQEAMNFELAQGHAIAAEFRHEIDCLKRELAGLADENRCLRKELEAHLDEALPLAEEFRCMQEQITRVAVQRRLASTH